VSLEYGSLSPYDPSVNRFDEWLNRLHGWRLALLFWVEVSFCFLPVAFGGWGLFGPDSADSDLALLVIAICSILAAVPVAVAAASIRGHRRNAQVRPLGWQAEAGSLLVCVAVLLLGLTDQVPELSHRHRVIAAVSLALILGGVTLFFTGVASRARRLAARSESRA
jgi:hypothetical protein